MSFSNRIVEDPIHPHHYHPNEVDAEEIMQLVFKFYHNDLDHEQTWLIGNILKYILRCPYKGALKEDLDKAKRYIDMLVATWYITPKED